MDADLPVVLQPTESLAIFDKYTSQLSRWNFAFEKFTVCKSKDLSSREIQGAGLLKIHHATAKIMAGVRPDMSDTELKRGEILRIFKRLSDRHQLVETVNCSRGTGCEERKAGAYFQQQFGLIDRFITSVSTVLLSLCGPRQWSSCYGVRDERGCGTAF
ncbi:hypothetical protein LAWI1_G008154 [Lachnellula willkommii]|uniref:Uncharacterized protein n=1 Tax=Lachnellula willkommii TaxID=215461 RepID=A0A559M9X0_9HELO|nr:hypothetical protein LAWI1_G008154 [Lachnellula willkommii]